MILGGEASEIPRLNAGGLSLNQKIITRPQANLGRVTLFWLAAFGCLGISGGEKGDFFAAILPLSVGFGLRVRLKIRKLAMANFN